MNLHRMLRARAEDGRPVRVGLIGAGKFGSMFLAQARLTTGFHVMAVADLAPENARAALERTGWPPERMPAPIPSPPPMRAAPPLSPRTPRR